MLPRHVVSGRRDRSERRAPEHVLAVPEAEEVGQVRVAAGELAEREREVGAGEPLAEVGGEGCAVQVLVGTDRGDVVLFGGGRSPPPTALRAEPGRSTVHLGRDALGLRLAAVPAYGSERIGPASPRALRQRCRLGSLKDQTCGE